MRAYVRINGVDAGSPPQVNFDTVLWDGGSVSTKDNGSGTGLYPDTQIVFDDDEHDVRQKVIEVCSRKFGVNKHDVVFL